jgi:hypothetical protein
MPNGIDFTMEHCQVHRRALLVLRCLQPAPLPRPANLTLGYSMALGYSRPVGWNLGCCTTGLEPGVLFPFCARDEVGVVQTHLGSQLNHVVVTLVVASDLLQGLPFLWYALLSHHPTTSTGSAPASWSDPCQLHPSCLREIALTACQHHPCTGLGGVERPCGPTVTPLIHLLVNVSLPCSYMAGVGMTLPLIMQLLLWTQATQPTCSASHVQPAPPAPCCPALVQISPITDGCTCSTSPYPSIPQMFSYVQVAFACVDEWERHLEGCSWDDRVVGQVGGWVAVD